MTQKYTILGLVAIAFVAGSIMTSTVAYASDHQNGTPFLQEELDAINAIVADILLDITELQNLQVSWVDVIDIPADFADDIDNDLLAGLSCSTDQIIKWDGTQWVCATSAINSDGGELALMKVDCNLLREILGEGIQTNTVNGCELGEIDLTFDTLDLSTFNLAKADLSLNTFVNVAFIDADLTDASFTDTEFFGVNFSGANLSGTNFSGAEFCPKCVVILTGAFADPPCIGLVVDEIFICDTLPTSPAL